MGWTAFPPIKQPAGLAEALRFGSSGRGSRASWRRSGGARRHCSARPGRAGCRAGCARSAGRSRSCRHASSWSGSRRSGCRRRSHRLCAILGSSFLGGRGRCGWAVLGRILGGRRGRCGLGFLLIAASTKADRHQECGKQKRIFHNDSFPKNRVNAEPSVFPQSTYADSHAQTSAINHFLKCSDLIRISR